MRYKTIVVDPPWPVRKIRRAVRPKQVEMPYKTMTVEEISNIEIPADNDCHLWLWATQKHLPNAFEVLQKWGFKYVCTFVWHKTGGIQPWNLPQYNCEFALYGRCGSPRFTSTKALSTCFYAPRKRHSEKPEEFYEMLRRTTPAPRLDMFNRRIIEGFYGWGDESPYQERSTT